MVRFGTVWPGTKLRFDAGEGNSPPDGNTVAKPAAVGLVTVTFITAAVASAGTGPFPATARSRVVSGPHGVENPLPTRESRMRVGVGAGVNSLVALAPPNQ